MEIIIIFILILVIIIFSLWMWNSFVRLTKIKRIISKHRPRIIEHETKSLETGCKTHINKTIQAFKDELDELVQNNTTPNQEDAEVIRFTIDRAQGFHDVMNIEPRQEFLQNVLLIDANLNKQVKENIEEKKDMANDEKIHEILETKKVHIDDEQNVHDSSVSKNLSDMYNKIDHINTDCTKEISDYIKDNLEDKTRQSNALKTLEHINKHNVNIFNLKDKEKNVLSSVWRRSEHRENIDNSDDIKMMISNALADCVENNSVVCSTGRTARILGALTIVDYDPKMSSLQTSSDYRNELLSRAQRALDDSIEENSKGDLALNIFARSFKDMSIDLDTIPEDTKNEFYTKVENKLKPWIDENIESLPKQALDDTMKGIRLI